MDSSAQLDADASANSSRHRARAKQACTSCRLRKVRCDVVVTGSPCTNCRLDSVSCHVVPRKRKWDRKVHLSIRPNIKTPPSSEDSPPSKALSPLEASSSPEEIEVSLTPALPTSFGIPGFSDSTPGLDPRLAQVLLDSSSDALLFDSNLYYESFLTPELDGDIQGPTVEDESSTPSPFVSYTHYNFADSGNLKQKCRDDVAYLEKKGCLSLPTDTALTEFLHRFFAHVHSVNPIMNEAQFWAADARIPLFVLQAMLTVACPYVPLTTLMSLGFPNVQAAQAEFYKRAKTLYQFELHYDHVANARGSVLLTYYPACPGDTFNTYWIITAVHHARCANADKYFDLDLDLPNRLELKRLWWCIAVRDRFMSLSLRRPFIIGNDDFDFKQQGIIPSDLSHEFKNSQVYDEATKQILSHFAAAFCELCIPLNSVLAHIYPMNHAKSSPSNQGPEDLRECAKSLESLDQWYQKTKERFQVTAVTIGFHKSLILYTKMIYMYYYTARASMCHHMMQLSATSMGDVTSVNKSCMRVQSQMDLSLKCITGSLMQLTQLDLVEYLPNTFVVFSALPFIWQILDANVMSPGNQGPDSRRELQLYMNIMNKFRSLYGNAETILNSIQNMISHIQRTEAFNLLQQDLGDFTVYPPETIAQPPTPKLGDDYSATNKWAKLLAKKPQTYLRIALTINHSLSSGKFPTEADFPLPLRSVKPKAIEPLKEYEEEKDADFFVYDYLQQIEDMI